MPFTSGEKAPTLRLFWSWLALGSIAVTVAENHRWTARDSPSPFYSQIQPCPATCVGKPFNWTVYSSVDRISVCDEPLLLSFNIHNPLADPATTVMLHACTTNDGDARTHVNALVDNSTIPASRRRKRSLQPKLDTEKRASPVCTPGKESRQSLELVVVTDTTFKSPSDQNLKQPDPHGALQQIQDYMELQENCKQNVMFSYSQGAVAGIFSGEAIDNSATVASGIVQRLIDQFDAKDSQHKPMLLQLCGKGRNADHVFGVVVDPSGNLAGVQEVVKIWSKGLCVNGTSHSLLNDLPIFETRLVEVPVSNNNNSNQTLNQAAIIVSRRGSRLQARADCRTVTVVSGDSCGALATKCGISATDFTNFNPDPNLCSTLAIGQRVCCSAGTIPDVRPKPNTDGSCFEYQVVENDYCGLIAAKNGLTVEELQQFNDGTTWGWNGCNNLVLGLNICLSSGSPPMPAEMSNAVCGPTKPGTSKPAAGQKLEDLNPCPLNVCCNVWGQCGIDSMFCVKEPGPTNNPGTSPPGKNGCVSSCGSAIVNYSEPPRDGFRKIGYYESWNWGRSCLNMRASTMMFYDDYTHIHWGFAEFNDDFTITIPDEYHQFKDFKRLPQQKIISFGGWGYSTEPATYQKLRRAMEPANRNTFADNIVRFLNDNGLDGVDIDWEYPGAPDIPGIPAGLPSDGPNYLEFLTTLKAKLPSSRSLSIAAPASFWYLKSFPIDKMAQTLDYIVYMTYDLHGQWDYGSEWASPGCPTGNCLRSHVNMTETILALSMITKAGVPTNKIYVGVSSYGRSFQMVDPSCTQPWCLYTGPDSGAEKGRCTDTAGYISNAEIDFLSLDAGSKEWQDISSQSHIMTWGGDNWVSYLTEGDKITRAFRYQGLNFAGTVDWAIDLQTFTDDGSGPVEGGEDDYEEDLPPATPLPPCDDSSYNGIDDIDAKIENAPLHCRAQYTLMGLRALLKDSSQKFEDMINHDYDHKFDVYARAVVGSAGFQITDFMYKKGNEYFDCEVTETQFCCSVCEGTWGHDQCQYCHHDQCTKPGFKRDGRYIGQGSPPLEMIDKHSPPAGNEQAGSPSRTALPSDSAPIPVHIIPEHQGHVHSPPNQTNPSPRLSETTAAPNIDLLARDVPGPGGLSTYVVSYTVVPQPCPPDYSRRGIRSTPANGDPRNAFDNTVRWHLRPDRSEPFWSAILSDTGIDQKDMSFQDVNRQGDCNGRHDNCQAWGWDLAIPWPSGYTRDDVANPRETAEKGLDNLGNLGPDLDSAIAALEMHAYAGDKFALVDAVSLPIVMLADAVESMAKVVEIADDILEKERKALIFAFLSAIFMLIPIAGEVLGSVAALATIGRVIAILGEFASVAVDIASVVDDPDNAALGIMGILLGPLAIADAAKVGKAANIRRGMDETEIGKYGAKVKDRMRIVNKCTNGGCRKN